MSEIKFTTEGSQIKKPSGKKTGIIILVAVVLIIAAAFLFNCFSIVNEGFVGVKYQFGRIVANDLQAGLNMHIPFVEEIKQVDIREQVYSVGATAYTSDTQTVKDLQLKLNYYYDRSKLSEIIRNVGVANVETKLLVPNVAKIAKNEIGKVKAEDLVQTRSEIQQSIQDDLTTELGKSGIIVTSFALEDLNFDEAFELSIQNKVIAAQDALKMQNKTKEREEEAKQAVIKAEGAAKSAKIAAEAEAFAIEAVQKQLDQSPSYIEYLKITKWNGILPQVSGNNVNPFVILDETNKKTSTTTNNTNTNVTPEVPKQ